MRLKKVILKRFCGFNDFEIDIGDFTVLVGPNNGGKTTILRAVKFGLDAVRIGFGDQGDPNYGAWTQPIHHIPLDPVARRLGLVQVDQLYHGRDQREAASVSLLFERGGGEVRVEAVCERADASIALRVTRGSKLLQRPLDEDAHDLIDELYRMRLEFVPPPGAISSDEHELDWHQLKAKLAQGQFAGTWRNRLHWMNEGGDPELFRCLVDRVREYMPGVGIRPPRRSKITSSVEANYVENGIEHDIFAGGDGLRTLITVVAPIELSDAQILLFDEPDSHLHSSAQRRIAALLEDAASEDRQILVATHAPDFIEAVGLESLVWVDRSKSNAQRCDEVGKVLVDLGAIGHTQALQHIGADAVVYVEGKADGHVFSGIFDRAGKGDWVHRCRLAKLGGYGDKDKLPFLYSHLTRLTGRQVAMAAILDADYTQSTPSGNSYTQGGVLFVRLPCKELENLFLLSDDVFVKAAAAESERRKEHPGEERGKPSADEVRERIDACTKEGNVREAIWAQWMSRWSRENGRDLREPGPLKEAESEFEKRWADATWRRRCCPGKLVLKHIRRWLKGTYKLNASTALLCKFYEPCDEMQGLIDALEAHVKRCLD